MHTSPTAVARVPHCFQRLPDPLHLPQTLAKLLPAVLLPCRLGPPSGRPFQVHRGDLVGCGLVFWISFHQNGEINACKPRCRTVTHQSVSQCTEYSLARATQFHCDSPSARPCIVSLCAACAVPVWRHVWRSGVGRRGLRGVRVLYIYISSSAKKSSKTPRALCREAALDTVTDSQSCSLSLVRSSSHLSTVVLFTEVAHSSRASERSAGSAPWDRDSLLG